MPITHWLKMRNHSIKWPINLLGNSPASTANSFNHNLSNRRTRLHQFSTRHFLWTWQIRMSPFPPIYRKVSSTCEGLPSFLSTQCRPRKSLTHFHIICFAFRMAGKSGQSKTERARGRPSVLGSDRRFSLFSMYPGHS